MNLLIPINSDKNLCSISEINSWALATIDRGKTKCVSFYENKEHIKEFIDYMIVLNENENVKDYMMEGINVLVAPMQKSIDDIIEAYMFRELHQLSA